MKKTISKMSFLTFTAFIALLMLYGCNTQAQPNVVTEQTVNCPFVNEGEDSPGYLQDPELGQMEFGLIGKGKYDCDDPYIGGKIIALLEGFDNDGVYTVSGRFYLLPISGGGWSGDCEITFDTNNSKCEYVGYGIFHGLQMTTEFIMNSYPFYRQLRHGC